MLKRCSVVICCLMLMSCESKLANQAYKEAKEAFEADSYRQAVGLLKVASDEGSSQTFDILFEQGEAFLKMNEYYELQQLDDLLLAWTDLNLIDSRSSFVKDEAVNLIKDLIADVFEQAETTKGNQSSEERDEVLRTIRLIEKRLGKMKLFDEEVKTLTKLREELE